jgi:hypothetical protein
MPTVKREAIARIDMRFFASALKIIKNGCTLN